MGIIIIMALFLQLFNLFNSVIEAGVLIGAFLFVYLYACLHKQAPNRQTAAILSILAFSAGQLYNRQYIKVIYFGMLYIISFYLLSQQTGIGLFIILILTIASTLDANRSANVAKINTLKKEREHMLAEKLNQITDLRNQGQEIGIDTNICMHEPDLLVKMLENYRYPLYLSKQVFRELDVLKKLPQTRVQAQLAFDIIEEYQRQQAFALLESPDKKKRRELGLKDSSDEKIIGTYMNDERHFVFYSNDKGARIIARQAGMTIAEI